MDSVKVVESDVVRVIDVDVSEDDVRVKLVEDLRRQSMEKGVNH